MIFSSRRRAVTVIVPRSTVAPVSSANAGAAAGTRTTSASEPATTPLARRRPTSWGSAMPDANPAVRRIATRGSAPAIRRSAPATRAGAPATGGGLFDQGRRQRFRRGGGFGAPQREPHGEAAATPDVACDINATAVLAHDRARDRETEAGALPGRPRGEERLEDARQIARTNATPGVLDAYPRFGVGGSGRDGDRSLALDRLSGIDEQVDEHLRQTRRQALDRGHLA